MDVKGYSLSMNYEDEQELKQIFHIILEFSSLT